MLENLSIYPEKIDIDQIFGGAGTDPAMGFVSQKQNGVIHAVFT